MKCGAESSLDLFRSEKKVKVEKSFNELLEEVFRGEFQEFTEYVNRRAMDTFPLSKRREINDANVGFVAEALRGTNVTSLKLYFNQIGPEGAKALAEGLRLSNVTSLHLGDNNKIGCDGVKALALAVPGTNLLHIKLDFKSVSLKAALALNRQKVVLTPYYTTGLHFMGELEKYKRYPSKYGQKLLPNSNIEVEYAGGIVMNLPLELVENVVSFLPGKNRNANYT